MSKEPELREDDGQERCHCYLPPGVSDQEDGDPTADQQRRGHPDLPGVMAGPPFGQPRLPDLPGQLGVVTAARLLGCGTKRGGGAGAGICADSCGHGH